MSSSVHAAVTLGTLDEIPLGEAREFTVGGERIAVFRPRSGGVYATQVNCPHRDGPLADGVVGGTTVICPFHAFAFDIATGEPVSESAKVCPRLKTYPVHVTGERQIRLQIAGETTRDANPV